MGDVGKYLKQIEPEDRSQIERICAVARELIPDAKEGTSYGMPALFYKDKPFIGFAVRKNFIGVYPYSGGAVAHVKSKLSGFDLTPGSIHVTKTKPIPIAVLKAMIRFRVAQIDKRQG